jgi:hypothetical protein
LVSWSGELFGEGSLSGRAPPTNRLAE